MQKEKVRKLSTTIIYGPVKSRRFGNSLGINLVKGKYCSFNCVYCFRGYNEGRIVNNENHFFSGKKVIEAIDEFLFAGDLNEIDDITIAGNGEPTDNKDLPEVIEYLHHIKRNNCPDVKLTLLTNGMGFVRRINTDVNHLLKHISKLDQVCIKIDSAIPVTWGKIANPAYNTEYSEWFESIKQVKNPVIQTMLMNGRIDNTTEEEIDTLIRCYRQLKPAKIYVITLNKAPADPQLLPVPDERLDSINQRIQREIINI